MLISDTIHYREDGTVSSVTRVVREAFKTPSGRDVTEDLTSTVTVADLTEALDGSYGVAEATNAELERKIASKADEHRAEIDALKQEFAAAAAQYRAQIKEQLVKFAEVISS